MRHLLTLLLGLSLSSILCARELTALPTDSPSRRVYSLGTIQGEAAFATSGVWLPNPLPANPVCYSDSVLFHVKDPNKFTAAQRQQLLIEAAQQLYEQHCQRNLKPAWRQAIRGFFVDEKNFQRLVAGMTHDEYRYFYAQEIPLPPKKLLEQQAAQQAAWEKMLPALRMNEARLREKFSQYHIQAWVPLAALEDNPFRYQNQIILTMAKLYRAESEQKVLVFEPRRTSNYDGRYVLFEPTQASEWNNKSSYLVVAKVLGRGTGDYQYYPRASVIAKWECEQSWCDDWLNLPDLQAQPPAPPIRRLKIDERF